MKKYVSEMTDSPRFAKFCKDEKDMQKGLQETGERFRTCYEMVQKIFSNCYKLKDLKSDKDFKRKNRGEQIYVSNAHRDVARLCRSTQGGSYLTLIE